MLLSVTGFLITQVAVKKYEKLNIRTHAQQHNFDMLPLWADAFPMTISSKTVNKSSKGFNRKKRS